MTEPAHAWQPPDVVVAPPAPAPPQPAAAPHPPYAYEPSPAMPRFDEAMHAAMPRVEDDDAATFERPALALVDSPDAAAPHDDAAPAVDAVAPVDLPAWASPGLALVTAVGALAWQLVSYYAREQLPALEASGATLDNFDRLVGGLPLVGSAMGAVVGVLLGVAALLLRYAGYRSGVRERVLQGVTAGLAFAAMLAGVLLPVLAG